MLRITYEQKQPAVSYSSTEALRSQMRSDSNAGLQEAHSHESFHYSEHG